MDMIQVGNDHFRQRVQDEVYSSLKQDILNLNLVPGTAISETDISQKFNVSRTPVRETFIQLANEGLIQVLPQKGTFVSRIDFSRVSQEFFIRESLEMAVLEPFMEKSTPRHFVVLQRLIEDQYAAAEIGDYVALVNRDDAFHRTFYEVADQTLSWQVLQTTIGHYHRIRLLSVWFKGIAANIMVQHEQILEAIKTHNITEARRHLANHIHKVTVEEKLLRDEFPDFFV
jgi:DNA-binding GntR family transcriptional regulator